VIFINIKVVLQSDSFKKKKKTFHSWGAILKDTLSCIFLDKTAFASQKGRM